MAKAEDRIIGVDIAKIVAMFLVVAVHVDGFGLPYVGDAPPSTYYLMLRGFLSAIFMSCINIFAIASGYVGIVSTFKLSRIIRLWIQVVFTGLAVIACIDVFTSVQVQPLDYLKACIPIAKKQYWYMTAYFMLCFMMPVLNAGIKALGKKELGYIILLLLGIICGESFFCSIGALGVDGGYSFEWLVVLYVVGAYVRLYNPLNQAKYILAGCISLCAMVAGWMPMLLQRVTASLPLGVPRHLEFGGYTSPFTVLIALCIFALCLRVRIASEKTRKVIALLSTTSLGVYLIHVQPIFFGKIFSDAGRKLTVSGGGGYFYTLIITVGVIYFVCTALDLLRIQCFRCVERLLSIYK